MNKIYPLLIFIMIITGCTTFHPRFEDSNQFFIEKTIQDLDISNIIGNKIDKNSKIALVSMESNETSDKALISAIEDQLISSLYKSGYNIYDRDDHTLLKMSEESNNN